MKRLIPLFLFLAIPVSCLAGLPGIKAAILVNLGTGQTLYGYNAETPVAPASLAKIMTMYLALDAVKAKKTSLNQKVTISAEAAHAGGSSMRVSQGEKVPLVRLLAGMAVSSGNDAATAVAQHIGGSISAFVNRMNSRAKALGMRQTRFKNPTGLPAAGQKTTAMDLAILCRSYLKNHPQARRFHSMKYFMHKGSVARNTNPLLGNVPGVDGLKTGWTVSSGYNLIVTAKRNRTSLLAIVLGAQSKSRREEAATALLKAGFAAPDNPRAVNRAISNH